MQHDRTVISDVSLPTAWEPIQAAALELLEPRLLLAAASPTNLEQYMLELINRGRADPAAEAARYGCALNEGIAAGTITTAAKQPLAFNPYLLDSAQKHSQWMLDNDKFQHAGASGSSPTDRMLAAGYVVVPSWGTGENIAFQSTSAPTFDSISYANQIHAALYIDSTEPTRGHRLNLLRPEFREIGVGMKIGVFTSSGTDWNALMETEDYGYSGAAYYLTGVAYADTVVADSFYTPGEGMGGVTITATRTSDSAVFTATTWASGGYSLVLTAGTYNIVASGGSLGTDVTYNNVVMGAANVKRDFLPGQAPANQAPTLTTVATLAGASQNVDYTITYAALAAAANENDPDGDAVSFRIEAVSGGTLTKGGNAVTPGATTLGPGESLVWKSSTTGAAVNAFTVKATDGTLLSAAAVQVKVAVAAQGEPEIEIVQDATTLVDGSATPVSFGTKGVGEAAVELTFRINNLGSQPLTLGTIALANNTGFEIVSQPTATVAAGSFTTFRLRMTTAGAGAKAADVSIVTNDGDENPFDFKVAGTVSAAPAEIEVRSGADLVTDGATAVHFPVRATKTPTAETTITINNLGGQTLTIGTVYLDNSVGFSVGKQPAASIPGGGSTTFTLLMSTATAGAKSANVRFTSSDGDESPFNFTVDGTVVTPVVSVVASDAAAAEQGLDPGTFTFSRTGPTTNALTINLTVGGTATASSDTTGVPTSVTFAAGSATATLVVTPKDDTSPEANETVTVTISDMGGFYGYTADPAAKTATVTIADNEPVLSVTAVDGNASEDAGQKGTFRIVRNNIGGAIAVSYTIGGGATNGTDYKKLTGTAVIPAGAASVDIDVSPYDDWNIEGAERVILTLGTGTGYQVDGAAKTAEVWIADNEPTLSIAVNDAAAAETGADTATLTVTRSNVGAADLWVYLTFGGSASTSVWSGQDFTYTSPLKILAGQTSATLTITPIDDQRVETAETVIVTLVTQYACGYQTNAASNSGTVTIADNEPVVSIVASDAAATEEGQDHGVFTVTRSNTNATQNLVVWFTIGGTAKNGTDYDPADGLYDGILDRVTIPAGATSALIDIKPNEDGALEVPETIILTLKDYNQPYTVAPAQKIATVTIADNEPTISVTAFDPNAAEFGLDPGTFRFMRSNVGPTDLIVHYMVGGTATVNGDFTGTGTGLQQVTIPAGLPFVDVTIAPVDDTSKEPAETVTVTIQSRYLPDGPPYAINDAQKTATVTIADWEPTVTVTAFDAAASEQGPDAGIFRITRSAATDKPLTVGFNVTGTAYGTTDYTAIGTSAVIPANATFVDVVITPKDDASCEPAETVILTLGTSSAYSLGAGTTGTVTIADNEPVVTVTAPTPNALEEGAVPGVFRFTRSVVNASAVTVNFTVSGTATAGQDYPSLGTSVVIPANTAFIDVPRAPINDAKAEPDETVIVTLGTSAAYTADPAGKTATVTIVDNGPTISVAIQDAAAAEAGSDAAVFRLSRDVAGAAAVTVRYTLTGTATYGTDYAGIGLAAVIPANQTFVDVTITPNDDAVAEPAETVLLTLAADDAYTINGGANAGTVTIADNEPTVSVTAPDAAASEVGVDTATYRISRSAAAPGGLTVHYTLTGTAKSPADYITQGGTAYILPNQAFVDVLLTPVVDNVAEGQETAVVTLKADAAYNVNGAADATTIAIADSAPVVSVTAFDAAASEQGPATATFRITRSVASTLPLTVNFTVGGTAATGTDYTGLGTSATIPANQAFVDVIVTPKEDAACEPAETVILALGTSGAYAVDPAAKTATVTIADNEPVVSVAAVDAAAAEGGNAGVFRITRSIASASAMTVPFTMGGTASSFSDYTLNATYSATIPAGLTSVDVVLTPKDDASSEAPETAVMTLGTSSAYTLDGAAKTATVTITDNEPFVSVMAWDAAAAEAGNNIGTLRITRNNVGTTNLDVNYAMSGSATKGTDYAALSGKVTIPAGSTFVDVNILPIPDSLTAEGNQTAVMTISPSSSYTVVAGPATVTIADAGGLTVDVSAIDAAASETAGNPGAFRFTPSYVSAVPVVVTFSVTGTATTGTDYTSLGTSVTIPAGAAYVDLAVAPKEDATAEPAETVIVTVTSGYGSSYTPAGFPWNSAQVTIADNEPVVSVTAMSNASEFASAAGAFRFTRSIVSNQPLTVNFTTGGTATKGTDYSGVPYSVTIPANAASVDVVVTPVDDTTAEAVETVIVTLSTSTAYTVNAAQKTATITIADNEPTVSIVANDNYSEEAFLDDGQYTVTRSVASASSLTVNYTVTGTASNGVDYTYLLGSVTIPANQTTAVINLVPKDDALGEGTETVTLTLKADSHYTVSGAAATATAVINDDEDAYEVDDSSYQAKTITVGQTQTHSISRAGTNADIDWIKFDAAGHAGVTIEINAGGGQLMMSLFRSASATSPEGQSSYSGGTSSHWYPLLTSGWYYIKIHEIGKDSTIAAYTVKITLWD